MATRCAETTSLSCRTRTIFILLEACPVPTDPLFDLNREPLRAFACPVPMLTAAALQLAQRRGAAAVAVPVLMLFLLVQQLRWQLYRCSESVAAAVADGQIAHWGRVSNHF